MVTQTPSPTCCGSAPHITASIAPPTRFLLFTQNTTRNAISWNPQLRKPNPNEVLHAVHLALHRALDPCAEGKGDACSWDIIEEPAAKGERSSNPRTLLVIPNPKDLQVSPPKKEYPTIISVKIRFYGPSGKHRLAQLDEALERLEQATGIHVIDRFVIGLDSIRWEGGEKACKTGVEDVDTLVSDGLWERISSNPNLQQIGVSDFSLPLLSQLLSRVTSASGSSDLRKPSINQLNFENEVELPQSLSDLAKNEGIQLQSHADNRVPSDGIERLLTEFEDRLPLPPSFVERRNDGQEAITTTWVLKYTVVLKDRELVADKG
ncbi:hypothetical protein FRC02_003271 [Tulasnella sp. 418]|nr:hypothetical protein FRC02_003271 [Tulasnella sp. 418]